MAEAVDHKHHFGGVGLAVTAWDSQNAIRQQRAPGGEAEAKESDEDSGGISRRTRLDIAPAPWHRLCLGRFSLGWMDG